MYNKIKKQNGERFAKAIRNFDNGIFDIPDLDKIVKYAGNTAEPIMNYLVSLKGVQIEEHGVYQEPKTLANMAGYDYYEVTSYKQALKFEKYYAKGEELCTFNDKDRTNSYHVIWLVKKNYKDIKRGNPPQRDDEYGTSVMSIQILKEGGFISIKNRYNHTVAGCDNTLNSNPDNIILGLSQALKHKFNVDFSSQKVTVPKNYVVMNGNIIKYHSEENNIYFGDGFYAKDGKVIELDKNKEIMIENVVLNLQTKYIDNIRTGSSQSFIDALRQEISDTVEFSNDEVLDKAIDDKKVRIYDYTALHLPDKIKIKKDTNGNVCIWADGIKALEIIDKDIVFHKNGNTQNLMIDGKTVLTVTEKKLQITKNKNDVKSILVNGVEILRLNDSRIRALNFPNVREVGNHFLKGATLISSIIMENLEIMGDNCCEKALFLYDISMPKLKTMGSYCFGEISGLSSLTLDSLVEMGSACFKNIYHLNCVSMNSLIQMGNECFMSAPSLAGVSMLNLKKMGNHCFYEVFRLPSISMYSLEEMGIGCFKVANSLVSALMPKLKKMACSCFKYCDSLTAVLMEDLLDMESGCFHKVNKLPHVSFPSLVHMYSNCFTEAKSLASAMMSKLESGGWSSFEETPSLRMVAMPEHLISDEMKKTIHRNNNPTILDIAKQKLLSMTKTRS